MFSRFKFQTKNSTIIIYFLNFLCLLLILDAYRLSCFKKRSNKLFLEIYEGKNSIKEKPPPDSLEQIGWIKELFDDQIPNNYYTHPEQVKEFVKLPMEIPGCLIDDAKNKLAIPLVDFNPDVAVDLLMKISRTEPSQRDKPVGVTVKGSGGGKTRAFEEIRRRLMVREKVLVVGITFNSNWSYDGSLDDWSKVAEEMPRLSYALSVLSRMASVVFDKDFEETVYLMKKQIDSLPEYYRIHPDILLRQFSSYLVDRVSVYREIDTFIVLVDEVMRIEDELKVISPRGSKGDLTALLRTALLNENISIDKNINSTLAISSLSDSPVGVTNSGRETAVLLLPNRLNSKDIVNKIFGLSNCSVEENLLMENIAATVDTVPRLAEFMRKYISQQQSLQNRDVPLINNVFVRNLINDCANRIDSRYETKGIVLNDKILSAIVYGDALELNDKDTLDAISDSIISNSLYSFNRLKSKISKVETSVLMLWRATQSESYDKISLGSFIHRGISEIIEKIINFKKEGDLLETFLFEWIKIRIAAAISYDQSSAFTLCRLIGLDLDIIPEKYKTIFDTPINLFKKSRINFVVDIVGSSRDNMEEMYNKIMNIEVSASRPIVLVRSIKDGPTGKEEAFDLLLIVYNPDSNVPFYIFFDTKSREEGFRFQNRLKKELDVNNNLEKRDQFNHTKTMMGLNNGTREFMYIYLKTHNITSDFVEGSNHIVMELGRDEAKKFFGPSFSHLYLTLRNSMNAGEGKKEF